MANDAKPDLSYIHLQAADQHRSNAYNRVM